MQNVYYVYFILDPRTSQPFYVGKGNGSRMMYHETATRGDYKDANKPHHDRIREILQEGLSPVYLKVVDAVDETTALNREREIIELYGRECISTGILLNISAGGNASGGRRDKIVCQHDLDGNPIAEFITAKEASAETGANASYISQVCQGKRISAGGFLWAYKGNSPRPNVRERQRAVEQFTKEGVSLGTFASLRLAEDATGVPLRNISDCCRRPGSSAGGFKWRYA